MSAEKIRTLNDAFRPGRSPAAKSSDDRWHRRHSTDATRAAVFDGVRTFDTFTAENDPHREHDFGSFEVDDRKLFWKID